MSKEEGNREGAVSPSNPLMVSALSEEETGPQSVEPVSVFGSRARRAFIHRLDQRIQKPSDLVSTLRASVEELGTQLNLDRCVLWIIGEDRKSATPVAQYCRAGVEALRTSIQISEVPDFARIIEADGGIVLQGPQTDRSMSSIFDRYWPGQQPRSVVCLVVEVDGVPRGLLSLSNLETERRWQDEEIELSRIVADRLAIAIKQDELIRQLQESAREAEALYRASSLLVDTSDLDRLYEQILEAFADVFGHPNANIWLVDEDGSEAALRYSRGDLPPNMLRRIRIDGPGLLAHSVRTASIVNVPDVAADPRYLPGLIDTNSELLVPMLVDNRVIAVFNVESPAVSSFTDRDERILSTFAERAARAIEQARLYGRMQEAAARDSLISRITRLLNQSMDAESIFQEMVEELGRHLNLNRCYLAYVNSRSGAISVTHQYSGGAQALPSRLSWEDCGFAYSAMGQTPLVSADVLADPLLSPSHKHFRQIKARGILSAPVTVRGSVKHTIICTTSLPRRWRPEDVELVGALAGQAAIARQRAELFQEVTASQREWQQTFDAMPEAVFVLSHELKLTRANAAAAALQGMTEGRPVGQSCCEVMARSAGFTECLVEKAIAVGTTIVREATPRIAGRPFLFTVEPTFAEDGSSIGAIVIASDLTPIKRAEAEAYKQRQFLSRLLEIARDAVFVLDLNGRFSWYNLRLSELSGYRMDELREMRLSDILLTGEPGWQTQLSLPEDLPESFEAQLRRKDSGTRYVLVTNTPIYDSGRISSVLGMLHDITEVRTAAEKTAQTDKLRALGQLAGGVAHNFNNLLAAILGHAQLLKRHLADHPLVGRIEIIEQAATDGAAMVRRINSFALRGSEERFEPLDLRQVAQDSIDITRIRWQDDARAQGVTYSIDYCLDAAPVVGSASQLREVFVNLIFNALDAMAGRGGQLKIETGVAESIVFARFEDQGIGISPEIVDRVFDPFFTTKGTGGTGLGLSGSRAIVERHGGRIEVESTVGEGARFTVWLPGVLSAEHYDWPADANISSETGILIIGDDSDEIRLIEAALRPQVLTPARADFVESASGMNEAYGILGENPRRYSVAIVALNVAGAELHPFLKQLKDLNPRLRLITLGDSSDLLSSQRGQRAVIDTMIARPYKEETLLLAVERALL